MTEIETETDTPAALISTEPIISTALMGQLGIVNIHKLNLIVSAKTSIEKKLSEIFMLLRNSGVINMPSDDFRTILVYAIYACRCKDESHTRIFSFPKRFTLIDRTVRKDTHMEEE